MWLLWEPTTKWNDLVEMLTFNFPWIVSTYPFAMPAILWKGFECAFISISLFVFNWRKERQEYFIQHVQMYMYYSQEKMLGELCKNCCQKSKFPAWECIFTNKANLSHKLCLLESQTSLILLSEMYSQTKYGMFPASQEKSKNNFFQKCLYWEHSNLFQLILF